tara:strand:+ start:6736 stop:7314 length:579 start_codon:yes stop_codon:yes gene_type:complete
VTYRFGTQETPVVGGPSAADLAAGYRVLHMPDWRATASNGAAFDNVAVGNLFNITTKVWSFSDSANKHIVSGDAASFVFLPIGTTSAKLQLLWGQNDATTGTDYVVWRFGAIQAETGDQLLTAVDANVRNVEVDATKSVEPDRYAYKIDSIELTLTGWEDRPTMFYLTRLTTSGDDDMDHFAAVYGLQVLVK